MNGSCLKIFIILRLFKILNFIIKDVANKKSHSEINQA